MDKTYTKVKDVWYYLYWVVDKFGATVNFMPSKNSNKLETTTFFEKAMEKGMYTN